MTLLSKTAILTANDLQTEDVEVPEWGGAVRVRSFTGRERDAFESSMVRQIITENNNINSGLTVYFWSNVWLVPALVPAASSYRL